MSTQQAKPAAVYVVAHGVSIATLRGTLHAGETVSPRDFVDARTFDELRSRGVIVPRTAA